MRKNTLNRLTRMSIFALALIAVTVAPLFAGAQGESQEATTTSEAYAGKEAPSLAELVASGQLPPLEERLPSEPLVLEPLDSIGTYGGMIRRITLSGYNGKRSRDIGEGLLEYSMDGTGTLVENVAKDWDMSPDGTVMTFYLREGMKWSDGEPYDATDVEWYWNNVLSNEDLTPSPFSAFRNADGSLAEFSLVDKTTFRIAFNEAHPLFFDQLGSRTFFTTQPPHYMEQFHKDFADADRLDAMVKEEGVDEWYQLYGNRANPYVNQDIPVLNAWMLVTDTTKSLFTFERNPYYWKVDPAGKQLPYVDEWEYQNMEDRETMQLKIIAGDVDVGIHWLSFDKWPVARREAEKNDYRVVSEPFPINGARVTLFFHYGVVEPKIDALLSKVEFRRALSLAIDRDEINQIAYSGTTTTYQAIINENHPAFDMELATAYTEYDPEGASALLDSIGLTEKDKDGFRLHPNGERITLLVNSNVNLPDESEIIQRNLRKVGLYTVVDVVEYGAWRERLASPDFAITIGGITGGMMPLSVVWPYFPNHSAATRWAGAYAQYYSTGGQDGIDPDTVPGMEGFVRLAEIQNEASSTLDEDERLDLIKEAMEILVDNMYRVGLAQYAPLPGIVKNSVKNIPDVIQYSSTFPHGRYLRPEQWYIQE